MKFCTKCGSKLEKDESVCDNCGYNFHSGSYESDEEDDKQTTDIQQFTYSNDYDEQSMFLWRKRRIL